MSQFPSYRLSCAPMLEWTDRHCRFFLRTISRHVQLYSEMVTTGAVLRGDRARLLGFNDAEHPLVLQLGGSDPADLAACARIAEDFGYDEVNLNVGCPSDRVQKGRFGACLMKEPQLVADCVAAMQAAAGIPVTVKTRIGVDDQDSYQALTAFVGTVKAAGCHTFIVHARKAWLSGLSPKENRDIPPLRYDMAADLKRDFSNLRIILNGGVQLLDEARQHLTVFDGVMMGRAIYHNPYLLADADRLIFGEHGAAPTRHEVLERFIPYVERELAQGVRLQALSRHILGLFQGVPGGRQWRRYLSENAWKPGSGIEVLLEAGKHPG
ncbi:tRNA dihydrouridine(20/20a) synthase DusA [Candidatus Methylospira mobilis]|uniref:tRNA-dihydrouridine(20/20a) synthase n=1 Tax=Candidatus Methylospira mobilis TaxID=1808979 RepID=A0A5Q0BMM8_9GAMM|nr:tRNA dihydrouridine(20/20a) synthase DusA [Candidatus Methylospira mobilis]QFY43357.1 tRNA dihydrouridine(20/20a) synthase DusA [Candidatus Methylospira mobilis]